MGGGLLAKLLDVVLPSDCACCGRPGTTLCASCRKEFAGPPLAVSPRVDPGVPCWSLGDYTGARRAGVIAVKERGRSDALRPIGDALADAIRTLRALGEIDEHALSPLVIVPAPTRAAAARRRGGDPVTRVCREAARSLAGPPRDRVGRPGVGAAVTPVLRLDRAVRDSVGLSAEARRHNLHGRIRIASGTAARRLAAGAYRSPVTGEPPTVILVDDVLTTGATVSESIAALRLSGISVQTVLVIAAVGRGRPAGIR